MTGRGVCRGAVPPLPAMRWRMIAHAIDRERVIACGGVNIFGDPKAGKNSSLFYACYFEIAEDPKAGTKLARFIH